MSVQNQLMIQRLKEEMKRVGLNARELSGMAKVGKSFVYDILSGKSSNPTTHKIAAVAEVLGVSVPYLVSGTSNDNETAVVKKYFSAIPVASYQCGDEKLCLSVSADVHYFKTKWIEEALKTKPENLRVMFVNSDSMDPTIKMSDMLLVDVEKKTPNPPGIFVLLDGSGISKKRLEYVRKDNILQVRVKSDNQKYSSYECEESEIKIVGKVVWFSRVI